MAADSPSNDREQEHRDFGCRGREQQQDRLLDVAVDDATFLDRGDDRGEVVVTDHDLRGLLRHLRSRDAHRHADVGLGQRRRVVDSVTRHSDYLAPPLIGIDDA